MSDKRSRPRAANTWPGPPWLAGEIRGDHLLPTLGDGPSGSHKAFSLVVDQLAHSVRINTPKFDTQREWAKNGQFTTKLHLLSVLMQLCTDTERPSDCLSVHAAGAGGDGGTRLVRQVVSVVRTLKCLASRGDCGHVDARFGMT